MSEESTEQSNSRPWLFKKGQSGNPSGRKKGSKSLKAWASEMIAGMSDEERQEFLDGLPKIELWKMAEGNPSTHTDVTTGGEKINTFDDKQLAAIAARVLNGDSKKQG